LKGLRLSESRKRYFVETLSPLSAWKAKIANLVKKGEAMRSAINFNLLSLSKISFLFQK
jgi:hypothetical protein